MVDTTDAGDGMEELVSKIETHDTTISAPHSVVGEELPAATYEEVFDQVAESPEVNVPEQVVETPEPASAPRRSTRVTFTPDFFR